MHVLSNVRLAAMLRLLSKDFNDTSHSWASGRCLPQLLSERLQKLPAGHPALVSYDEHGEECSRMTYQARGEGSVGTYPPIYPSDPSAECRSSRLTWIVPCRRFMRCGPEQWRFGCRVAARCYVVFGALGTGCS